VAAVLTPPDPASQIGLAIPAILLYEISIWLAQMIEKKRTQAEIRNSLTPEDDSEQKSS
jgi:sec-independent protein translocase protein TatC